MGDSQSAALAKLLAGFADRPVSSAADLEAWEREAHALVDRLDTEFADASRTLTVDEWWYIRHFLDDADIRLKEPSSAYTNRQEERLRQVIAKLGSA
jgi:hypothetical protein